MEDFYMTMHVLSKKAKAINEPAAHCFEDVSSKMQEEFKRKVRISTGNFQNLSVFANLMWPPTTGIAFCFFSHKFLRWIGPLLLLGAWLTSGILAFYNNFYLVLFLTQCLGMLTPTLDYLFKKVKIHSAVLRFPSYFYMMNAALLFGFFKYIKGVKTNAWQPTERNQ
jgi:hypothetical protein